MSLREIDLNENIVSSESNQERQQYYIPDLNVSIEELGVGFNQSPSRNSLPFDLNDEPFIEDDTQIEEILQQSNSNTTDSFPQNSSSHSIPCDFNSELDEISSASNSHLDNSFTQNSSSHSITCDFYNEQEEILPASDSHLGEISADDVTSSQVSEAPRRSNRNLLNEDRMAIFNVLLGRSFEGRLKKGTIDMVGSHFGVSRSTIKRIWKQGKESGVHVNVSHKRKKNCGHKNTQIDFDGIRDIPLHKRTSVRSTSYALNVSKSTLHRALKSGAIRRHSNAIKPFLKEENKRARLRFCLLMLDPTSLPHDPTFVGMYNMVHIDEKWFYRTKKSENYYLLPDEEDPIRACRSKNYIEKAMFLTVVARPRFDAQKHEIFSRKIGVFPLVTQEPAKRNSVNRAAGTLETKPITSVTRPVIKSFMIDKVVPAMKEIWPIEERGFPIFIQQDNARTHIDINDEDFRRVASQDGFDIRLMCQLANSPDLNVLDLGFFNAIQSLQHKEVPNSIDELVKAVEKSFEAFSTVKSNRIFLTLQSCMIEIMKKRGSNKYKLQHLKKKKLERQGKLPTRLKCDATLVEDVLKYLE